MSAGMVFIYLRNYLFGLLLGVLVMAGVLQCTGQMREARRMSVPEIPTPLVLH